MFSYEQEVGFSEEDIGLKQFREVGTMVAALKNGELGPAKEWVSRQPLAPFSRWFRERFCSIASKVAGN